MTQLFPGNIDLSQRPMLLNKDGSVSTVRSISIGTPDGEVLIPTIGPNGEDLTEEQAIDLYRKTKQHLGVFDSPEAATTYAKQLHDSQASEYRIPTMADTQPTIPWDPAMAAGIAQQPLAQAGAPQAPNSFAAMINPPPMQMQPSPPVDEADHQARAAQWEQHLNDLMQSPEVMLIGYALMHGVPLSNAMMAGQAYRMFQDQNDAAEAQAQQEFALKKAESEANVAQSNASAEASKASAAGQLANAEQTRVETAQKQFDLNAAPELLALQKKKAGADIAQSYASAGASGASAAAAMQRVAQMKLEMEELKKNSELNAQEKKLALEAKKLEIDQAEQELQHMKTTGTKMGTEAPGKTGMTPDQSQKSALVTESGAETQKLLNTSVKGWLDANPDVFQEIQGKNATAQEKWQMATAKYLEANPDVMSNLTAAGKQAAAAKRKEGE